MHRKKLLCAGSALNGNTPTLVNILVTHRPYFLSRATRGVAKAGQAQFRRPPQYSRNLPCRPLFAKYQNIDRARNPTSHITHGANKLTGATFKASPQLARTDTIFEPPTQPRRHRHLDAVNVFQSKQRSLASPRETGYPDESPTLPWEQKGGDEIKYSPTPRVSDVASQFGSFILFVKIELNVPRPENISTRALAAPTPTRQG